MAVVVADTQGKALWRRKTLPNFFPPPQADPSKLRTSAAGTTPSLPQQPPSQTSPASPTSPGPTSPSLRSAGQAVGWGLRRNSSRISIVSTGSIREGSSGRPVAVGLGRSTKSLLAPAKEDGNESESGRSTRKYLYSLAAVSMQNRKTPNGTYKGGRKDSIASIHSRLLGLTAGVRRSSGGGERSGGGGRGTKAFTSLVNLVGLKHRSHLRLKEARCKILWRKARMWCRIIIVLNKLFCKHAASAMTDPSSPFYSGHSTATAPVPTSVDLLENAVDKDHYMFFDPSHFKANRQRRMSQEVQRILSKPPEERTPEEIHFAMIGLRDIPQLAVYTVRMQQNLAKFGEFQCFEAKRMILKQGHYADGFYIVLYGNVIVAVKNIETGFAKIVVELPRGETFGDLAIVSGGTRNSSVLTKTYTQLLYIHKSVYEEIFMTGGTHNITDPGQDEFIGSLQFLRGWPLHRLSEKENEKYVRHMYIQRDGVIVRDSNCNDWLIVVKTGSLTVLKKLVRSKPTVSRRSGLYHDQSCVTAFQSFVNHSRDYNRWLSSRGISLPPPLQVYDDSEDDLIDDDDYNYDEEEVEEEEVEEEETEEGVFDDEFSDTKETEEGEEERVQHEIPVTETRRRKAGTVTNLPVRPQTGGKGGQPPVHSPRMAWSAKLPYPVPRHRSAGLLKRTKLGKPKIRFEEELKPTEDQPEIGQSEEVRFANAKRTILDDLDANYLNRARILTEADLNPQFVRVHTLTKGDVFGLANVVFPDQPSFCLVSNGAECMLIDRRFYLDNCPPELSRRLKVEVSPYPSDSKLQQDLVNRINWDVYKDVVKRQVCSQSQTHVTVTPL